MDLYLKVRHAHFEEGLSGRRIARDFGISRDSVSKMLAYSEPPGYRRTAPIRRPRLDPYTGQIDQWLGKTRPVHASSAIRPSGSLNGLRDECGFEWRLHDCQRLRPIQEALRQGDVCSAEPSAWTRPGRLWRSAGCDRRCRAKGVLLCALICPTVMRATSARILRRTPKPGWTGMCMPLLFRRGAALCPLRQ